MENSSKFDFTNFLSGIVGAFIAALALILVTYIQNNKELKLERNQFESKLILESIVSNDANLSKENIRFLIESGLISHENEKVIGMLNDTTFKYEIPEKAIVTIEPSNSVELNSKQVKHWSGMILADENGPIESVELVINPEFQSDTLYSFYSRTKTDENGLFNLTLPEDRMIKVMITKDGYESIRKVYLLSRYVNLPEQISLISK